MGVLRSERAELNKLKELEDKRRRQGVFAGVAESGTTPSKNMFDDVVSNIAPKTPPGKPPNDGRRVMEETTVPGYQTPTQSSKGKTLNLNDL